MLRKHSRTIRCQQPKALKSVNYRHGWHSDATEHILWNFHPFIATSEKGPCFFFPKFVWMIRLDIFWSWGHPLSWERWPKRFIFVISIGETQEPIASNLYIEPPKKLDLPIFGWKICNIYILYVYKYLKRYKYISYICIQIYLWHARKSDTNISISICI